MGFDEDNSKTEARQLAQAIPWEIRVSMSFSDKPHELPRCRLALRTDAPLNHCTQAAAFEDQKQKLLEDIQFNGPLGKAISRMVTIEYQNRGLPYMQVLLGFENECNKMQCRL